MFHYKLLTEKSKNNNRYNYKAKRSLKFRAMTDI